MTTMLTMVVEVSSGRERDIKTVESGTHWSPAVAAEAKG